ncbi:MAG: hypothetical protein V1734_04140 [Nanoarchaeota archaeon]
MDKWVLAAIIIGIFLFVITFWAISYLWAIYHFIAAFIRDIKKKLR